jgi:hypothetical protein
MKVTLDAGRVTALIAALTAVGIAAVFAVGNSSAAGRDLTGKFCQHGSSFFCMSIAAGDGPFFTGYDSDHLTLRPGTYWITVNDVSTMHDYELRGPSDTAPVTTGDNLKLSGDTFAATPGEVTTQVLLKHGWYRLYCAAPTHESKGMWVDFEVGGEGQVG